MTKVQMVQEVRARLDRENPGWRDVLRREMDEQQPGWVVAMATIKTDDGREIEVALLANPEHVSGADAIDPAPSPNAD